MTFAAMAIDPEWRADVIHDDRGIGNRSIYNARPLIGLATAMPMAKVCLDSNGLYPTRTRTAFPVPLPLPTGREPGATSLKGEPHVHRPRPPR